MIKRFRSLTAYFLTMEQVDKNQTIDETKRKLQASREKLEGELEYQLQDIKKDASDLGKQVLIVGGGLYLGWQLVKRLTTSKEKRKEKKRRKKQGKQQAKGPGFVQMLLHQLVTMAVVAVTDEVKSAFKQNKAVNDHKKDS